MDWQAWKTESEFVLAKIIARLEEPNEHILPSKQLIIQNIVQKKFQIFNFWTLVAQFLQTKKLQKH